MPSFLPSDFCSDGVEFAALAKNVNAPLVPIDKKFLSGFPSTAKSLKQMLHEYRPRGFTNRGVRSALL
jgi:hypothetical protein